MDLHETKCIVLIAKHHKNKKVTQHTQKYIILIFQITTKSIY